MTRFGVDGFVERFVPWAAMLVVGVSSLRRKRERKKPPRLSQVGRGQAYRGTVASLVTLTQYTRASLDSQWPKEKISILQTLFVRRNILSKAHMNTIYRKGSAKERTQKGAWLVSGLATHG